MRKKGVSKILGAAVTTLLLLSSLTTIAVGISEEKTYSSHPLVSDNRYEGRLRVYIVEIESRWEMHNRQPYHNALLDLVYDEAMSIKYHHTYEETIEWKGDIEEDNVLVIAALFNPEAHKNYADPPNKNPFNAYYVDAAAGATPGNTGSNTVNEDFTHTVLCEKGTATWCPYCVYMGQKLTKIYESGDYPFYFISMVMDKCNDAAKRMYSYNLKYLPTAFFDGGEKVFVGGGVEETELRKAIESCGRRDVHELNLSLSVEWLGDGELEIRVSITNNEGTPNNPPETPTIEGPTSGKPGEEYAYTLYATDPDDDDIYYCIDWGDGNESCIGPFPSGTRATAKHIWQEEGVYIIKAKTKDIDGAESEEEWLKVTIPKGLNTNVLLQFLEEILCRLQMLKRMR
jgi:thiol-disulfide isomerase/thioredoxin